MSSFFRQLPILCSNLAIYGPNTADSNFCLHCNVIAGNPATNSYNKHVGYRINFFLTKICYIKSQGVDFLSNKFFLNHPASGAGAVERDGKRNNGPTKNLRLTWPLDRRPIRYYLQSFFLWPEESTVCPPLHHLGAPKWCSEDCKLKYIKID